MTRTSWFALNMRRLRNHSAHVVVFGLTVALASLVMSVIVGFIGLSATSETKSAVAAAGAGGQHYTLETPSSGDAAQQRAAAEGVVRSLIDTRALTLTTTDTARSGNHYLTLDLRINPDLFTAAAVPGLVDGLSQLQRALGADPVAAPRGVSTDGSLPAVLATAQARLNIEQSATVIPVALAAIVALVALVQAARLLVDAMRDELALLRSRGASPRLLASTLAIGALAVAIVGASTGAAAAGMMLAGRFGATTLTASPVPALCVTVFAVLAAFIEARRTARATDKPGTNRAGFVASVATVVVVLTAAGVSTGQFLVHRSPVQASASGVTFVDPVIAAAPALAMLALIVLGLAAFAPAARVIEALSVRGRGTSLVYPARYLARRSAQHTVSAVVIALALGSVVITGALVSTTEHLAVARQHLLTGSDVRVTGVGSTVPVPSSALSTARVLVSSALVGTDAVELVALPHGALTTVVDDAGGLIDTQALAEALPLATGGVAAPSGELALSVDGEGQVTTSTSAVVVRPSDGAVTELSLPSAAARDLRVIHLRAAGTCERDYCLITVNSPTPVFDGFVPHDQGTGELGQAMVVDAGPWRATYDAPGLSAAVPVAITTELASRIAAAIGDTFTVTIGSGDRSFAATVARIVPLAPGTTNARAVIVDLGALAAATQSPDGRPLDANELWFRTDDVAASTASLTGYSVITATETAAAPTATAALLLGAAGAALLAVAALAAGATLSGAHRRSEPNLLRALGMTARQVSAIVRTELWLVTAIAVVIGLGAGAVVSVLMVSDFARTSLVGLPAALPSPVSFDPVVLLVWAAITIAACMGVGVFAGHRANRSSAQGRFQ
jgi:hypothetical protein